jgi:hypothetical protein
MTEAQAQAAAVSFAHCMRAHGVVSFPDPTSPRQFKESFNSIATHAPNFQSAAAACQHILGPAPPPQRDTRSRAQVDAMLAFARCFRSHGFPSFPDPTSTGLVSHQMLASAGISLNQPAVVQVADSCVGVTHGLITKAMVARFAAGQ